MAVSLERRAKLRLQLFELVLGRLALGQVADEAGKEAAVAGQHLSDLKLHGEGRAVLALAGDDAIDADDAFLSGREVAGDIAVMAFAKRRRHEHAHILANHLGLPVAEQALGGGVERLDDALFADHDRGVRHGIENGPEMRLARPKIVGGVLVMKAGAAKLLAEPGDADADGREDRSFDDFRPGQILHAANKNSRDQTERGGNQARTQAAGTGGEQNGRDEQEERAVTVQPGAKPDPQQKQHGHGPNREPIVRRSRLRARHRLFQSLKIAGFGLKTQLKPLATL